jgi:hypothetical protein
MNINKTKMPRSCFLLSALALIGGTAAQAESVTVTLDNPNQKGAAGDTLQFFGTITYSGIDPDPVFLNSDDLEPGGSPGDFTVDDLFFSNVPVSIPTNGSSGDIDLFDIIINEPFTDSLNTAYQGVYSLLGGVDGNSQDVLTAPPVSFTVTVVVPEPAARGMLSCGLLAFRVLWWRRGWRAGPAKPFEPPSPTRNRG